MLHLADLANSFTVGCARACSTRSDLARLINSMSRILHHDLTYSEERLTLSAENDA